jgi:hypothetical protein
LRTESPLKRIANVLGAVCLILLSGCVVSDANYGDYYGSAANYDASCDYYTPPWGYPPDYCRYPVWSQPVYYAGIWYGGPIYYRSYGSYNLFWLNGGWRRDEWRGARPRIDWNHGHNKFWQGEIHRGRAGSTGRSGFGGGNVDNSGRVPNGDGRNLISPSDRNSGRLVGPGVRNNGNARKVAPPNGVSGQRVDDRRFRNNGGGSNVASPTGNRPAGDTVGGGNVAPSDGNRRLNANGRGKNASPRDSGTRGRPGGRGDRENGGEGNITPAGDDGDNSSSPRRGGDRGRFDGRGFGDNGEGRSD